MARPKKDAPAQLTVRQQLFVVEFMVDLNAVQAAIRAGYSVKYANHHASELAQLPHVAAAIAAAMEERSKRVAVTADMVLERWRQIAWANPNEVIQHRRTACRHCYGINHAYQWQDLEEFSRATVEAAEASGKFLPPDDSGGFGFKRTADPHPDCPKCEGEGVGDIHANDTRRLSGSAALLYAGVEQTKDGFKVKMHDQMKALDNIARHLGMFVDKVEHTSPDGSMTPQPPVYKITET